MSARSVRDGVWMAGRRAWDEGRLSWAGAVQLVLVVGSGLVLLGLYLAGHLDSALVAMLFVATVVVSLRGSRGRGA
jgi:hypothetical protein